MAITGFCAKAEWNRFISDLVVWKERETCNSRYIGLR